MSSQYIQSADALDRYCDQLENQEIIAFDTEFVSESSYRPVLCLIQVATENTPPVVIDPIKLSSTDRFWKILASGNHTVIAHAAREETRFCFRHSQQPIGGLFDSQLAAGFVGLEYPASLASLVSRIVGKTLPKGETRTDWARRPLSTAQIDYALSDVTELVEIFHWLSKKLNAQGRWEWLQEETAIRQQHTIDLDTSENFRRVSGSNGLKPRQMEIVRQLWLWRENLAKQRDRNPRSVLRDDLIVELARRGSADLKRIASIRGMEQRRLVDQHDAIADAIADALETPDSQLPKRIRGRRKSVSPMLAQFLSTAMACVARTHLLAPSIVGNSDDVKDFLAQELEPDESQSTPALSKGWRGAIVGDSLRRVLRGELAIRVADIKESQPLEFFDAGRNEEN